MSNAPREASGSQTGSGDESQSNADEFDSSVLEILRCPVSHEVLVQIEQELWCAASKKAYPIADGIPVMIVDEARDLSDAELNRLAAG